VSPKLYAFSYFPEYSITNTRNRISASVLWHYVWPRSRVPVFICCHSTCPSGLSPVYPTTHHNHSVACWNSSNAVWPPSGRKGSNPGREFSVLRCFVCALSLWRWMSQQHFKIGHDHPNMSLQFYNSSNPRIYQSTALGTASINTQMPNHSNYLQYPRYSVIDSRTIFKWNIKGCKLNNTTRCKQRSSLCA
jgi:hypothetical protein